MNYFMNLQRPMISSSNKDAFKIACLHIMKSGRRFYHLQSDITMTTFASKNEHHLRVLYPIHTCYFHAGSCESYKMEFAHCCLLL